MNRFPNALQPLTLRGVTFKNRIQFLPQVCCLSSADGEVTEDMAAFVGWQARTGAGWITIGDTQVDTERGSCFYGEMNVTSDKYLPGMVHVCEEAHKYGAKLSIELAHAGRGASHTMNPKPAYAPSAIPLPFPSNQNVIAIGEEEMQDVIDRFVDCALRCKRAGFDMIMIHSGHHNLLAEFLSNVANKRTDEYGGSIENRMRFPLRVLKAVREAVGEDFPLEMRVGACEEIEGGYTVEDTIAYLKEAQKYIDMVQVSRGIVFMPEAVRFCMPDYLQDAQLNVPYAAKIREAIDIPVSCCGNISTMEEAEEIIKSGKADVVGFARAFIADPDLIHKSIRGCSDQVRPCIRCHDGCGQSWWGFPVRCTVNPTYGLPTKYDMLYPAVQKKRVMVVGGGTAGMTAAVTAHKRGHDVTLYEATDRLGGLLHDAGAIAIKHELARYTAWAVKDAEASGVKIVYNTRVDQAMIEAENPDVLIIATGSVPVKPPIKGIDLPIVVEVSDVDSKKVAVGQNVIVCGGGSVGLESGLQLALDGKNVKIVDMLPVEKFADKLHPLPKGSVMRSLNELGVELLGDRKIKEFTENGIVVETKDGSVETLEADSVVLALGMRSNNPLKSLEYEGIVSEIYYVGDCEKVENIRLANANAYAIATRI